MEAEHERLAKTRRTVMWKGLFFSVLFVACGAVLARPTNDQDKNKEIARTFFEEVIGQGHLDRYADSHSKDFVVHGRERDGSLEEDIGAAKEERRIMPDMKMRVNLILAERDLVAVHWTVWGTNTQPGMGLPGTGKKISVDGMTIFRFKAGKISEEWGVFDRLSVMQQAGVVASPQ
jgi:steroid delta-isomerase-like uncharacterized protein